MDNDVTVEVPNVPCPLELEEMAILQSVFSNDPYDDIDGDMGTSLYIFAQGHLLRAALINSRFPHVTHKCSYVASYIKYCTCNYELYDYLTSLKD